MKADETEERERETERERVNTYNIGESRAVNSSKTDEKKVC